MTTLSPTDRQRLADSLRRVEMAAHDFFYGDTLWDSPQFPAAAAARLDEMARLLMKEKWHMDNLENASG